VDHEIERLADDWDAGRMRGVASDIVRDRSGGYSTAVKLALVLLDRHGRAEVERLAEEIDWAEMVE
jgi:hypothetical protein